LSVKLLKILVFIGLSCRGQVADSTVRTPQPV
jgi:hypothetical protein